MRSYGIVRSRFWAWAKERDLTPAARELVLYCLTSPHTTGIGCFRLPIAYIAEDLGTVPDTVRQTVDELSEIGFLKHDDSTGWVWLVGFLDHNPIANINVGKSFMPFIEAVPKKLPFYGQFLDSLGQWANRFPDGYLDRLRNGMPNGSDTGMPNQEQEHEQEHEHEQDGAAVPNDGDILAAYEAWNEAAARNPSWPKPLSMSLSRRRSLSARVREVGGLEGFLAVLSKAEASHFIRHEMTGWGLDWFLKPANFTKVREGNYDRGRTPMPADSGAKQPMQI